MLIIILVWGDFMATEKKEIMTAKDVAEYLNLHPFTVHKYAREGKIPAFKLGADWRFDRRLIDKWIRDKVSYNTSKKRWTPSKINTF